MNRDGPSPYEPFDLLLGYKNNGLLRIGWLQKNGYKKKKRGYKTIERESGYKIIPIHGSSQQDHALQWTYNHA